MSEADKPDFEQTAEMVDSFASSGLVIADRYTLREKIGEGGMGEVWVAKQSEPVKRRVALKSAAAEADGHAAVIGEDGPARRYHCLLRA